MRIGIDLGGTKIEAIALDSGGAELARRRVPSPQLDYAATLNAIVDLVEGLETELGVQGAVGIGIPGAISPATGLVKNANSTWLIGKPIDQDLQQMLARPVRMANDANCFAVSEATDGAAAGVDVTFGVIIGTGTGGGIAIQGQPLIGANAIAGEWGHNPLPWPQTDELAGPNCYCGKRGCIETWLSGPGFAASYERMGGDRLKAEEIVERAGQDDELAEAALQRYEDRMARSLATVINLLDPDVVVLGGGMSQIARLYHSVPKLWGKYVFSDRIDTQLLPTLHGDSSGVRGAAWLWD